MSTPFISAAVDGELTGLGDTGDHAPTDDQRASVSNWTLRPACWSPHPTHAPSSNQQASKEASRGLDEVRRIIDDLRPPVLDDCGLATAVATFATRFNTASLTVASSISTRLPELPAATETAAYRIAAEALTNVTRHADASTAHLALEVDEDGGHLVLQITDNGKGLPAAGSTASTW